MTLLFHLLAVILVFIDNGASGVDTYEVSVKERDSVIFHTGVKTNQQEVIKWYFNDIRIAEITGDLSYGCTDVRCNEGTERFRDRLKLDHQTGSLTITNTRNTDSGLYELRSISSSDSTDKTFNVTVTVILGVNYKLQINSSRNSFSISRMKIFSVSVIAVPDSDLSPGVVAGISVAVISVLLVVAVTVAVVYYRRRIHTAVPQDEKKDNNSPDLKDIPLEEVDTSLNQTERETEEY